MDHVANLLTDVIDLNASSMFPTVAWKLKLSKALSVAWSSARKPVKSFRDLLNTVHGSETVSCSDDSEGCFSEFALGPSPVT